MFEFEFVSAQIMTSFFLSQLDPKSWTTLLLRCYTLCISGCEVTTLTDVCMIFCQFLKDTTHKQTVYMGNIIASGHNNLTRHCCWWSAHVHKNTNTHPCAQKHWREPCCHIPSHLRRWLKLCPAVAYWQDYSQQSVCACVCVCVQDC